MLRKLLPLLPLAIFVLAVLARVIPGPRTVDDAFITFRYARNLLAGSGFAYNPGEAVLGTTTPLFTLLLAALALPFGAAQASFPWLALAVSALADGLTAVLLLDIGRKLGSSAAGLAAALAWAVAPFSVTFAIGGLETSVYVLFLVALMNAYLDRRIPLASGLGAAAILTRPDAVLLVGPLLVHHAFTSQPGIQHARFWRANLKAILIFVLPLFLWVLFAWVYFGSPLPQTLLAKSNAYRVDALSALVRLLQHYATPFLEHLTLGLGWLKIGLWLYPFLFILGVLSAWRRKRAVLVFGLFPALYLLAFAVANPLLFRWYLTPPLPFYFLFIALGVHKLAVDVKNRFQIRDSRFSRMAVTMLILLPALLSLRGWTLHPAQPAERPAPEMAWIELEGIYRQAASFLRPRLAVETGPVTVAAADVGVLGYQLPEARILDLVGLNSTETLPYYPLDAALYGDFLYAVSPDLIADQQPGYVVILEVYGRDGLLQDPRFHATYELVYSLPTNIYGEGGGLVIYQRN
jgi:MFS family permease